MTSLTDIGFDKIWARNFVLASLLALGACVVYLFLEVRSIQKDHKKEIGGYVQKLVVCDSMRVQDYIGLRMEARKENEELRKQLLSERRK